MTMSIAIADDHPLVISGLRRMLEQESEVEIIGAVNNATELVALLTATPCNLIITDYLLPDKAYGAGSQFIEFLRQTFPDVRIVVFTELPKAVVERELTNVRNIEIIGKDAEIEELLHVICDRQVQLS